MNSIEGLELANINQIDSSLINNINNGRTLVLDSNIIDIFGTCYCCQEQTDLRSPCICRTYICDSCLVTYVKYNDKCTICNSELDIYIPTPTSTISGYTSESLSFSLSYDDINDDYNYIDFKLIIKLFVGILSLFHLLCLFNYLGMIGHYYMWGQPISIELHINYEIILIGGVYFIISFLTTLSLSTFIYIIICIIQMIWYYLSCKYIRNN